MIKKEIGAELRRMRVEHGLTQEALSHNADISISFLKKLEAGNKQPSALTLFKLSRALETTPDKLILPTYQKWLEAEG
ncbi:helix-turn-helix domain-containing protein [Paremcibacter congregatus]|nr:helix-turn-helix transcriptional regulator [Paremcibacter congregatus]